MRARLLALVVSLPLAIAAAGVGAPASAQPGANCGAYPPGNAYGIRANVSGNVARVVQVRRGNTVVLSARVVRNGENCSGRRVSFFVHGPREFVNGVAAYHKTGDAVTDDSGLAVIERRVINSFRWYAGYTSDNGTGIATSRGADRLIQAVK